MNYKLPINTIIDAVIEQNFDKIKDKLLEQKLTYDDIKNQLLEFYSNNLIELKNYNFDLYRQLLDDNKLYEIYYQTIFSMFLLSEYGQEIPDIQINEDINVNDVEQLLNEIELFTTSFGIKYIITGIIMTFLYYKKIPGMLLLNLRKFLYNIGKKISNIGKESYYMSMFFKNMPKKCIDKLNSLTVNWMDRKYIGTNIDSSTIEKIMMNPMTGKFEDKYIETQYEMVDCTIRYLIKLTAIQLMLFYKCLFDNKKFMDLIDIKKRPTESLLQIDKLGKYQIFEKSNNLCAIEYENFKKAYNNLIKIIEIVYKKQLDKRSWAYKELDKSIQEASKYAQKLLDEGKRKQKTKNIRK